MFHYICYSSPMKASSLLLLEKSTQFGKARHLFNMQYWRIETEKTDPSNFFNPVGLVEGSVLLLLDSSGYKKSVSEHECKSNLQPETLDFKPPRNQTGKES